MERGEGERPVGSKQMAVGRSEQPGRGATTGETMGCERRVGRRQKAVGGSERPGRGLTARETMGRGHLARERRTDVAMQLDFSSCEDIARFLRSSCSACA